MIRTSRDCPVAAVIPRIEAGIRAVSAEAGDDLPERAEALIAIERQVSGMIPASPQGAILILHLVAQSVDLLASFSASSASGAADPVEPARLGTMRLLYALRAYLEASSRISADAVCADYYMPREADPHRHDAAPLTAHRSGQN